MPVRLNRCLVDVRGAHAVVRAAVPGAAALRSARVPRGDNRPQDGHANQPGGHPTLGPPLGATLQP
eukprot:1180027-Prorocentrum_minimum.AAC.3